MGSRVIRHLDESDHRIDPKLGSDLLDKRAGGLVVGASLEKQNLDYGIWMIVGLWRMTFGFHVTPCGRHDRVELGDRQ